MEQLLKPLQVLIFAKDGGVNRQLPLPEERSIKRVKSCFLREENNQEVEGDRERVLEGRPGSLVSYASLLCINNRQKSKALAQIYIYIRALGTVCIEHQVPGYYLIQLFHQGLGGQQPNSALPRPLY